MFTNLQYWFQVLVNNNTKTSSTHISSKKNSFVTPCCRTKVTYNESKYGQSEKQISISSGQLLQHNHLKWRLYFPVNVHRFLSAQQRNILCIIIMQQILEIFNSIGKFTTPNIKATAVVVDLSVVFSAKAAATATKTFGRFRLK